MECWRHDIKSVPIIARGLAQQSHRIAESGLVLWSVRSRQSGASDVRWNHSFRSPAGCGENAGRWRVGGGVVFGLINEMPDRFDTDLGAAGKAVLGGQNQRLALLKSIDPSSGRGDECVGQWASGEVLDGIEGVERDSSVSDGTSFKHDYGYHLHGSRWCDSGWENIRGVVEELRLLRESDSWMDWVW